MGPFISCQPLDVSSRIQPAVGTSNNLYGYKQVNRQKRQLQRRKVLWRSYSKLGGTLGLYHAVCHQQKENKTRQWYTKNIQKCSTLKTLASVHMCMVLSQSAYQSQAGKLKRSEVFSLFWTVVSSTSTMPSWQKLGPKSGQSGLECTAWMAAHS